MRMLPKSPGLSPGQGWTLNRAHPLARGLASAIIAVPGGFLDLVTGRPFKPSTATGDATKRGYATRNNSAVMSAALLPTQPAYPVNAASVAGGFICGGATSQSRAIASWCAAAAGNYSWGMTVNTSNVLNFELLIGSLQRVTSAQTVSVGQFVDFAAGWSRTDGGAAMYVNGVLDGSATLGTGALTGAGNFGLFSHWATNEVGQHSIAYLYTWNERRLTAAEAAELYRDPYQILTPIEGIGRYLNAAGGSAALASIMAAQATLTPALNAGASLSAILASQATLSPALVAPAALAATFAGQATLASGLRAGASFAATLTGTASLTPALSARASFSATLASQATLLPALVAPAALSAALVGQATLTPSLRAGASLAASMGAVSSITASLASGGGLAATMGAASSLTAAVFAPTPLAATLAGQATLTPSLRAGASLAASMGAVSSITASLASGGGLAATMGAASSLTAAVFAPTPLSASFYASARITSVLGAVSNVVPTHFPPGRGQGLPGPLRPPQLSSRTRRPPQLSSGTRRPQ